jgi:hypothetical protein
MNTSLSIAALLALPLVAVAPPTERIAFQPGKGTALAKNFDVHQEFTLEDSEIKVNGAVQKQPDDVEMAMSMDTHVALGDVYADVDGGRVTKLARKYEKLSGAGNMSMDMGALGNQSRDLKLESELEGRTVVFAWDADQSAYTPRFDEHGGDAALLENLVEDFDLRGFVPGAAVEIGATWKVDVTALRTALAPGTGHALLPARGGEERMSDMVQRNMDFAALFRESASRTLDARFESMHEADGRRIATISIEGKVHAQHDATDEARRGIEAQKGDDKAPEMQKVLVDVQIEVSGELEWDLDGGHARSLKLTGSERIQQAIDLFQTYGASRVHVEDSSTLSGPFDVKIAFRRNG